MDFKIGLIRPRELRAVLLIWASLATILAVSIEYLRPAPSEAPVVSQAPVLHRGNDYMLPIAVGPEGAHDGYVKWQLVDVHGGSGGH